MQRIQALDRARGFTVFFIPVVHSFLLYAEPANFETFVGYILRFVAEGPGAQLFLFHMGFVQSLSDKSMKVIIKRAAVLLMAGFALNVIKFVIPGGLNILPHSLVAELKVYDNISRLFQLIFLGDILHFAALALPIICLVKKLPYSSIINFLLIILIGCFSNYSTDNNFFSITNYLNNLIAGYPPAVYFPLLPWLIYPLSGLLFGTFYKRSSSAIIQAGFLTGAVLMAISFAFIRVLKFDYGTSFYHTAPAGSFLHLGFIFCWIAFWFWISLKIPSNFLFTALENASKKITLIYLIQWPLIIWCLPAFGYNSLGIFGSCIASFLITYLTFQLADHFLQLKSKWKEWNK